MTPTTTPRVPGDPGHAATFPFPVVYEVVHGFTFNDLQTYDPVTLTPVLDAVLRLQDKGVHFIIADCGLFSLYQREISAALHVPFIGSSLSLIPFIKPLCRRPRRLASSRATALTSPGPT